MSGDWNKSDLAFEDAREAFDRALAAPHGICLVCENRAIAVTLRARFHYFRKIDRNQNKKTYEPGHPMHGNSSYDPLILRIPQPGNPNEHMLFIERRPPFNYTIEEI